MGVSNNAVLDVLKKEFLFPLEDSSRSGRSDGQFGPGDIIASVDRCWGLGKFGHPDKATELIANALGEVKDQDREKLRLIAGRFFTFFASGKREFDSLPHEVRSAVRIARERFDGNNVGFFKRCWIRIEETVTSLNRWFTITYKGGVETSPAFNRILLSAEVVRCGVTRELELIRSAVARALEVVRPEKQENESFTLMADVAGLREKRLESIAAEIKNIVDNVARHTRGEVSTLSWPLELASHNLNIHFSSANSFSFGEDSWGAFKGKMQKAKLQQILWPKNTHDAIEDLPRKDR